MDMSTDPVSASLSVISSTRNDATEKKIPATSGKIVKETPRSPRFQLYVVSIPPSSHFVSSGNKFAEIDVVLSSPKDVELVQ